MIGMIRSSILILLVMILSGCMKTVCRTDTDCHKKLDWNNKGFTLVRTIVTNGINVGN
jgi:hypothetical protein